MGMFDTLIDGDYETQVKCFYRPIYDGSGEIWHSGGLCSMYGVGDRLPLVTPYYEYPLNFYIHVDDRYGETYIPFAVVRNGRFDGFLFNVDDATEFGDFYSYYGGKIRVANLDDMKRYIDAYNAEWTKPHESRNFIEFYEQWHAPTLPEHRLGELHECWQFAYATSKFYQIDEINYAKNHIELGRMISEFQQQHPDVFDAFTRKWEIEWEV